MDEIQRALENDQNVSIASLTYEKIDKIKRSILKDADMLKKLNDYRHVDELHEFRLGCFIRYIHTDNLSKLMNGGFLVQVDLTESGTILRLKSKYIFSIRLDDCILFQKLTDQEHVLLTVIDHLKK